MERRPYTRKDELVKKNVVPEATDDTSKHDMVAKQAPTKATKK